MANNRMYLVCVICAQLEETTFEHCVFYLAKYYPTSGWYVPFDGLETKLESWLAKHVHREGVDWDTAMWGEFIQLHFDSLVNSEMHGATQGITEAVARAMSKSK